MRPHVMIVDDAADQLELMRMVFKMVDPGLQVTTASGGNEALAILRSNPNLRPKVILLDLRMPGKDGKAVLAELKSDPDLKRIPVCAYSNGDVEKDVCDCYEQGASFYFKKPTGLEPLKKFVEQFNGIWFEFASHCPGVAPH